jgi:hypothetical protein
LEKCGPFGGAKQLRADTFSLSVARDLTLVPAISGVVGIQARARKYILSKLLLRWGGLISERLK